MANGVNVAWELPSPACGADAGLVGQGSKGGPSSMPSAQPPRLELEPGNRREALDGREGSARRPARRGARAS